MAGDVFMRRNTLNFLVDALTLLAIFVMIATGLVIRFVLPPGTGGRHGGHGLVLWGMGRHDWGGVHFWASIVLGVLLLLHVALHWSWVCMTLYRWMKGTDAGQPGAASRHAYGLGFLVALVVLFGGFTWYAHDAVRETNSPQTAEDHRQHPGADAPADDRDERNGLAHDRVHGSMTLADIEVTTSVSVAILRSELGLPENVPADERLGRLGRRYGFDMETVRQIVAEHMPQSQKR